MRDAVLDVGPSIARMPAMTSLVRGGPKIRSVFGTGLMTHCVVTTSLRSQM